MPINVFGEGPVQTAYVGSIIYNLTGDITLYWPNSYMDTPSVMAMYVYVQSTTSPGFTITIPNATQVSVGQNFIIRNASANSFNVVDNTGGDLGSIDPGEVYYFILLNNSTAAGVWDPFRFGTGTSQADANLLAGLGLLAVGNVLNTNTPVKYVTASPYTVTSAQNAALVVWQTGAGAIALPSVGTVPDGFYFSVNNPEGSKITVTGDATIDNTASFEIGRSQSVTFVKGTNSSNQSKWWSLGFGQQTFFAIAVLQKDISISGNIILSASEAQRNIQQYTGTLVSDTTVFFPQAANEWTISNFTSGNFTLKVQLGSPSAPVGPPISLPQNTSQILYSDGSQFRPAQNTVDSSTIAFPNGTESEPSITFIGDTSTGLYLVLSSELGITAGGTDVATFSSSDIIMHQPLTLFNPLGIISGGTGAPNRTNALNNLMPATPATGDMVYFNGTDWVKFSAPASNRALVVLGGIPSWSGLSMLQTLVASNSTASTLALTTAFATVTGLTQNITLARSSNSVLVSINIVCDISTANGYLALYRGVTQLAIFGGLYQGISPAQVKTISYTFLDGPGAVGPTTYSVQAASATGTATLYINRDASSTLTGFSSSIDLTEIGR